MPNHLISKSFGPCLIMISKDLVSYEKALIKYLEINEGELRYYPINNTLIYLAFGVDKVHVEIDGPNLQYLKKYLKDFVLASISFH